MHVLLTLRSAFFSRPFADALSHADLSVCSLPVNTLSHNFRYALLQTLPALSTIPLQPFQFAGALPALDWVPNCHSNPITQRVRRKRQRLPPSLLIENASGLISRPPHNYLAEAFPIKASDHTVSDTGRVRLLRQHRGE